MWKACITYPGFESLIDLTQRGMHKARLPPSRAQDSCGSVLESQLTIIQGHLRPENPLDSSGGGLVVSVLIYFLAPQMTGMVI